MDSKMKQILEKKIANAIEEGHIGEDTFDLGEIGIEEALSYHNKRGAKVTIRPHKSK
jgi:hypothetical protein